MRLSYRWLKSFLNFPIELPDVVETLTMAGLEVEEVLT